jgi:hypothetical protein
MTAQSSLPVCPACGATAIPAVRGGRACWRCPMPGCPVQEIVVMIPPRGPAPEPARRSRRGPAPGAPHGEHPDGA